MNAKGQRPKWLAASEPSQIERIKSIFSRQEESPKDAEKLILSATQAVTTAFPSFKMERFLVRLKNHEPGSASKPNDFASTNETWPPEDLLATISISRHAANFFHSKAISTGALDPDIAFKNIFIHEMGHVFLAQTAWRLAHGDPMHPVARWISNPYALAAHALAEDPACHAKALDAMSDVNESIFRNLSGEASLKATLFKEMFADSFALLTFHLTNDAPSLAAYHFMRSNPERDMPFNQIHQLAPAVDQLILANGMREKRVFNCFRLAMDETDRQLQSRSDLWLHSQPDAPRGLSGFSSRLHAKRERDLDPSPNAEITAWPTPQSSPRRNP